MDIQGGSQFLGDDDFEDELPFDEDEDENGTETRSKHCIPVAALLSVT